MSAPETHDTARVRSQFDASAIHYAEAAVVQREAGNRLLERFDVMRIAPNVVLDVGCGAAIHTPALVARFPEAQVIALDQSAAMLASAKPPKQGFMQSIRERFTPTPRAWPLQADMTRLPIKSGAIDVLWSNFSLQWANDIPALFVEWNRALKNDGVLMFAAPGPDTLIELRRALASVESAEQKRAHNFVDLHDLGDMLIHAGFADPVMDMEVITLEYATPKALWRDLRNQGAMSAIKARPRGLMSPRKRDAINAALESQRATNGMIRISVEVVYGHAWKVPAKKTAEGHGIVRLESIGRGKPVRE
jgi:malonyl-CoA O-methyltransferase